MSFIASKLGLSRLPVREAIRIVEAHHFIETLPQKGAYVREVTCEEIPELFVHDHIRVMIDRIRGRLYKQR